MEYTGNLFTGFEKRAEDIISQALENARQKYGYYKAHIKGYYEFKNNAPKSELYDVLNYSINKDRSISVFIDNNLFFKYSETSGAAFLRKTVAQSLFPLLYAETVKSPDNFVKINVPVNKLGVFIAPLIDKTIADYFPSNRFGCCSKYKECSYAGKCLHEDLFYAKGCMYRENLEKGKIFYGDKNAVSASSIINQNSRCYKGQNLKFFPDDYTIVDLETTGGSFQSDCIIEIGALKVRNGNIVDEYSQLIKPSVPISRFVTNLTGITNESVANAPTIEEQLPRFLEFVKKDIVVGHNVNRFDINFLYDNCMNVLGKPFCNDFVDTLEISKKVYPSLSSHSLEHLVNVLGLEDGIHHRALADCYHTYRLFDLMKNSSDENTGIIDTEISAPKYIPLQKLSETTVALNELQRIVYDIICDDVLTNDEVLSLNDWLKENQYLAGNYPFDVLYKAIGKVLEDGIIEETELDYLKDVLKKSINPVENSVSNETLNLYGAVVCLTGEFDNGSKQEVSQMLAEQGAVVCNTVNKHTDILIVGGQGNSNWSSGNYGNKIKKALEMQEKGHHIKILKESDIFGNGDDDCPVAELGYPYTYTNHNESITEEYYEEDEDELEI